MSKVTIKLSESERAALIQLAQQERRDPRDQAALILSQELDRLGLLAAEAQPGKAAQPAEGVRDERA